jgi:hypothetical protein
MFTYKTTSLFPIFSLLLLAYTAARAYFLSMTVDEGTTFFNIVEQRSYWQIVFDLASFDTANNHILNSLLAKLGYQFFGLSTLSLRLGSVLAHGFYLFFAYKITQKLQGEHFWAACALFCLLNLNPYALDFFSLSRGYAWNLAASLAGVYYFLERDFTKAAAWMVIGILGNFTFLNNAAALWLLFNTRFLLEKQPFSTIFRANLPPSVFLGILAVVILPPIVQLKNNGEFLYGADSLVSGLGSIVKNYIYFGRHLSGIGFDILAYFFSISMVVSIGLATQKFWQKKDKQLFYLALLPVLSLGLMLLQHLFLGSKYLTNRTAVVLYPFFVLSSIALLTIDFQQFRLRYCQLLVAFFVFHFVKSINFYHCIEWWKDAYNRRVIQYVAAEAHRIERPLSIGTCAEVHPGLSFHSREAQGWVTMPVWEAQFPKLRSDTFHEYYYILKQQQPDIHADYKIVQTYEDMILLKR